MPVELQPSRSRSRVQFPPGRKACSSVDRAGCFTIPRRRGRSRLIATSGECRRDYRLERPFIRKGGRRFRWRPAQAVAQQSSRSNLVAVLDRKDFDTSRRMPMGIQRNRALQRRTAPDSPLSGARSHPSRRRGPLTIPSRAANADGTTWSSWFESGTLRQAERPRAGEEVSSLSSPRLPGLIWNVAANAGGTTWLFPK